MITLDVAVDFPKRLSSLADKRIRAAAAQALSRTAFDARDAVRASLPQNFTLRRPWVAQGIGALPATPQRLVAVVYSRDRFMRLQETGGEKSGKIAIPVGRMAEIARTQVIPKSLWPKALRGKKGVFVRQGMVLQRSGKRIAPLWLLRRRQMVEPRLQMRQTSADVVQARFAAQFRRAWAASLKA